MNVYAFSDEEDPHFEWARTMWEMFCDRGMGGVYGIRVPRRRGKTTALHRIATEGFNASVNVVTYHTSTRATRAFRRMNPPFNGWCMVYSSRADARAATVYLFDEVYPSRELINKIRLADGTVIMAHSGEDVLAVKPDARFRF